MAPVKTAALAFFFKIYL